ncbi:hypothetical protein BDV06DRAFT_225915 [Aspergillus oleicola]
MATNDTITSITKSSSTKAITKSIRNNKANNNNAVKHLPFYPAYTFKSSPTNFAWGKFSGADIHRLTRRPEFGEQGLFFYQNHPIRFVNVLGVIVARFDVPRRTILTIDDSSGGTVDVVVLKNDVATAPATVSTIPSAKAKPNPETTKEADEAKETHLTSTTHEPISIAPLIPGKVFQIKGTLSIFRSIIQINLERFFPVPDTKAEMRFVEARTRFLVDVLSNPWILEDGEIEALRKQADEEGMRVEEEQARLKKRGRKREAREEKIKKKIEEHWEREEKRREEEARSVAEAGREYMRLRALKRRREATTTP